MKTNCKIIEIDGGDGVGKETQVNLLKSYFEKMGHDVKCMSFPNYDSESSTMAVNMLRGKIEITNPYARNMAFALDRSITMSKPEIKKFLDNENGVLILDRYTASSLLFDTRDTSSIWEFEKMISTIRYNEYTLLDLPEPDLTLLFYVSPGNSVHSVLEQRAEDNPELVDVYESNIKLQAGISERILKLSNMNHWRPFMSTRLTEPKYKKIDVFEGGRRLTIKEIHNNVIKTLEKELDSNDIG